MKIVLVCPSNILFMPYVYSYEKILRENKIDYTIINWDRLRIEDEGDINTFWDKKRGHQRDYYDYLKYRTFVIQKLNENRFDKVIVFGLQLAFFLGKYLRKYYQGSYLIDIRDHHRIIDFFSMKRTIKGSQFTVISSPGYKQFLPRGVKYVVNHNTEVDSLECLSERNVSFNKRKIRIACIGALRDFESSELFINTLKNNQKFELLFHGEGDINRSIQDLIENNNINNVFLTGRYLKEQEEELYLNSDLINIIYVNHGIDNKTFLPNRLYNAVKYKKPMIAVSESYLSEIIKKYRIGLVIDSMDQLENSLIHYIETFDETEYEKGARAFLEDVISENANFNNNLQLFCQLEKSLV